MFRRRVPAVPKARRERRFAVRAYLAIVGEFLHGAFAIEFFDEIEGKHGERRAAAKGERCGRAGKLVATRFCSAHFEPV